MGNGPRRSAEPKGRARVLAAFGLGLCLAAAGCQSKAAESPFLTTPVDEGPVVARVTASGTLSALVTVQVGSQVSGRVSKINVDFNSKVKKGEVIAEIDPQLYEAALEQAKANLVSAQANVVKAKAQALESNRELARQKALQAKGLLALADVQTAEANAAVAKASVQSAKAALEQSRASLNQAKVNLSYTRIVSPIDGVVISRSVDVGQTVAASLQAPTLFTIAEDLSHMQVDTSVAESDVGRLADGMPATFTVGAFPNERFRGKIRQIRNAAQTLQNVVTYDAVIDVPNDKLELRPGMTANVTVTWADRKDVLRVPNAALRYRPASAVPRAPRAAKGSEAGKKRVRRDPNQKTVWVLEAGKPTPVKIEVGVTDGTYTEVTGGDLKRGEALITAATAGGSDSNRRKRPMRL